MELGCSPATADRRSRIIGGLHATLTAYPRLRGGEYICGIGRPNAHLSQIETAAFHERPEVFDFNYTSDANTDTIDFLHGMVCFEPSAQKRNFLTTARADRQQCGHNRNVSCRPCDNSKH